MLVHGSDRSLPSVPRSRGCLTCVARKTRCDGRRPTCRACEGRKQICRGYRRDHVVFLNEGWRGLGVAASATPRRTRSSGTRGVTNSSSPNPSALAIVHSQAPPGPYFGPASTSVAGTETLVLCPSLPMDRTHLHIAYFMASFGTRPSQALGSLGSLFRHYLSLVSSSNSHQQSDYLSSATPVVFAVDALAYCHFGTANADSVSVRRSFHMYGIALQSMSAKLAEMNRAGSDLGHIADQDWQHFAFFCLVMAFWEMKMSPPASRNWENHLRSLANAIFLRDTSHPYSRTNYQLLASSRLLIILQTLSASEPNDWQQHSPMRLAWLAEVRSALEEAHVPNPTKDYELYQSMDDLMADVTPIVSFTSRFDQLVRNESKAHGSMGNDFELDLVNLYDRVELILSRNEERLARWSTNMCEISLESWLSLHQDGAADPVSSVIWASMRAPDVRSCLETVLTFRTMLEYHSITLCWTVIMSLRLLLGDMLTFMVSIGLKEIPSNSMQKVEDHRIQLLKYAVNVLQTICYATYAENRAVGPFVLTTAFQLTIAVLERECNSLQSVVAAEADCNRDKIRRCNGLKALAARYLDWAVQNKIPIKIDLGSLRKWESTSRE